MFRSAEVSVGSGGTDADVKTFFDSLRVRQESNRAVLSAISAEWSVSEAGGSFGPDAGTRTSGAACAAAAWQIPVTAAHRSHNLCN